MHNLKVDEKGNAVFDDEKFKERAGLNSKTSCKNFIKAQEKAVLMQEMQAVMLNGRWWEPDLIGKTT